MLDLAAGGGPGPWRQMRDLLELWLGRSGAKVEEYYQYALWQKANRRAFRSEFLPARRRVAFNAALEMPGRGPSRDVIEDKLATAALFARHGLPVVSTLAVYGPGLAASDLPDGGQERVLSDRAALIDFLSTPREGPIFAKPRADSLARGAASLVGPVGGGRIGFADGRTAPIDALADEIVADWATGYLFQPFYQCHAEMIPHVGPAMASVRIVTLLTDRGVEPWYALLRIPARNAMHDGAATGMRSWPPISLDEGRIGELRSAMKPMEPVMHHWLDPDRPFTGMALPFWREAMEIVTAGHAQLPGFGILGWDVFLTDRGAVLNEVNASPGNIYQHSTGRGMMNPDMAPLYRRALAFARSVRAGNRGV